MPEVRTPERPPAPGPGARSVAPSGPSASTLRLLAVLLGAVFLVVAAASALPGELGPGIGMVGAGVGAAAVFYALNRPVLAVGLLLFCVFLRSSLRGTGLPVEPLFLALVVVLAAAAVALARRVNQAPQFGAVEAAMALYLVWNIGSAILPHDFVPGGTLKIGEQYSIYHFIMTGIVMPFVLYVVGRFVFDRAPAVRSLLWVVMGFFAYSVWVSIAKFYAPDLVWPRYIINSYEIDDSWAHRAVGVFNQPVANGIMLLTGFLLAVHLALQPDTRRWERNLLGLLALASLYAIYFPYPRVVWLGFVLALLLAVVYLPRSRKLYTPLLIVLAVGVATTASTFFSEDRSAGGVGSSYEVEDRLNIISTAWWAIGEKPVFGWGIGAFGQVNTYFHQQWSQEVDWIRGYGIASHETELGIAAELGIPGLLLYLAVVGLLVLALRHAVRTLPREGLVGRDLAVVVSILFTVWVVTGLTADLRFFDFGGMLMLLLVGTVVGAAQRHELKERFRPPPASDEHEYDLMYLSPS